MLLTTKDILQAPQELPGEGTPAHSSQLLANRIATNSRFTASLLPRSPKARSGSSIRASIPNCTEPRP